jgi:predicted phage baseplate assembly protein
VPIESPNLDDLTFATMRDLLIRQIPTVAPEWTDYNSSDPGITLIQLFAYLAEQVTFRLNRVPDKNYVEFLKLIGVRLQPAAAAVTRLSFILSKPEAALGFLIPAGGQVQAASGGGAAGPPIFETDADLDVVPAQLAALVTTASGNLRNILVSTDSPSTPPSGPSFVTSRFTLVWDGKTPKLKDMPAKPVPVFPIVTTPQQQNLWIGLAFNPNGPAGFVGQRVTLTIQFDDDEQPSSDADVTCAPTAQETSRPIDPSLPQPPVVSYSYYRPPQLGQTEGSWQPLSVLSDTTGSWTQSGQLRLDVPNDIGPIPDSEWVPVFTPTPATLSDICAAASSGGGGSPPPKAVPHPLIGAIKAPVDGTPSLVPVSGWIQVNFQGTVPSFFLRAVSFNVTEARAALTIRQEVVGNGTGLPGQTVSLAHGNILDGSLQLAVSDPIDQLLHVWTEVDDFDAQAPDAQVYVLDPEAGQITFGDGVHGRPAPDQQTIAALQYRWGGGVATETAVATVTKPLNLSSAVQDVTNIVAATGGKDAETLDEAKARAPEQLQTFGRAVTAADFRFFAKQTPGVRVGRAEVVPLHKPYASLLTSGPGIDFTTTAAGAVSVIVVPDTKGPYPTPTDSMLRAVCEYLDRFRLVTTEVHTVPPMYVRLYDVCVHVAPSPGYSQSVLRESIATRLETYFHVLTGGSDGTGFPFGAAVHHADLVAQVAAVPGVARVDCVEAHFDGNAPAPAGSPPPMTWRNERLVTPPKHLVACIVDTANDVSVLQLAGDENVFVDSSDMTVVVVAS